MPIKFENEEFSLHKQPFVWPKVGHTVLEEAGANLVRELARVGWDVPGINVEFRTSGRGTNVFRTVSRISGDTPDGPFELNFFGPQERKGRYNALSGLSEATVPPGIEVRQYTEEGTVTAKIYVGKDWRTDGPGFIQGINANSRLVGKPKTYLCYEGRMSGSLRHENDLGREYDPEGAEPTKLPAHDTLDRVAGFIEGTLVHNLHSLPTAPGADDINEFGDANLRRLSVVERIEAPEGFPVLYAWTDLNDGYRILGRDDPASDGSDDFVLSSGGMRLVALGDNPNRVQLPPRAHDGFAYASTDPSARAGQVCYSVKEESLPVEIRLKFLNEVYVVDNAVYDKVRKEMWKKVVAQGRDSFNHSEIATAITAVAQTMVPVTEYDGSYEEPTYLIGRQLHADEARLMRGPIKVHVEEHRVRAVLSDEESGKDIDLCHYTETEWRKLGHWSVRDATRLAERVSDLFRCKVKMVKDHDFPVPPPVALLAEDKTEEAPSSPSPGAFG